MTHSPTPPPQDNLPTQPPRATRRETAEGIARVLQQRLLHGLQATLQWYGTIVWNAQNPGPDNDGSFDDATWTAHRDVVEAYDLLRLALSRVSLPPDKRTLPPVLTLAALRDYCDTELEDGQPSASRIVVRVDEQDYEVVGSDSYRALEQVILKLGRPA